MADMRAELKPCPFCGGEVSWVYNSADRVFRIYHKRGSEKCQISEPIVISQEDDITCALDAIRAWNRRASDA